MSAAADFEVDAPAPRRVQVAGGLYHGKVPPGAVYVGRRTPTLAGSRYANPYKINAQTPREEAVRLYRLHLANDPQLAACARAELAGRDVACWCGPGELCHGDVLVELAASVPLVNRPIIVFAGKLRYLSNTFSAGVTMSDGITYSYAENAFQAQKTMDMKQRADMAMMAPLAAKRLGREVVLRPGWDQMRKTVMLRVLMNKFTQNPVLGADLVATGGVFLCEGNNWHDQHWGDCFCSRADRPECVPPGRNWLGQLLMAVRFVLAPEVS
jgi:ribA/ribD-fused uncharacterized protein